MSKLCGPLLATVVTALLVFPVGSSAQADLRLRPATPLDPIYAILDAFVTHDVVALGDVHHDAQLHELRMKLIEDPRFPDVVRDIVFEFGTPQHQAESIAGAAMRGLNTLADLAHGHVIYAECDPCRRSIKLNTTHSRDAVRMGLHDRAADVSADM